MDQVQAELQKSNQAIAEETAAKEDYQMQLQVCHAPRLLSSTRSVAAVLQRACPWLMQLCSENSPDRSCTQEGPMHAIH